MIYILEDVLQRLQNAAFTLPNVTVREAYSADTVEVPLITVEESAGNDGVYLDNLPNVTQNILIVESYAAQTKLKRKQYLQLENSTRASTEGGRTVALEQDEWVYISKRQASLLNMQEADKILTAMGLTMIGTAAAAPYADSDICRTVARYSVYIDNKTKKLYRRIN